METGTTLEPGGAEEGSSKEQLGVSLTTTIFRDPLTLLDLASELDASGIDQIFISESSESVTDVLTLLAGLAFRTQRAKIGSAIAITYLRHPISMAEAAANIDWMSNQRLVLGFGSGHHAMVVDRLGLSLERPLSRMRDYLAAARATLDTSPIAHKSEHFQITGSGLNWRPTRHVPILLAALREGMVRLAGTLGDGIICSLATRNQIRRFRGLLIEAAEAAGRDPAELKLYATVRCCVRDNREEARSLARRGIGYSSFPFYQQAWAREGLPPSNGVVDDATLDAVGIAGTPEDFREGLAALRDAGVDVPLLASVWTEPDQVESYRRLVAEAR